MKWAIRLALLMFGALLAFAGGAAISLYTLRLPCTGAAEHAGRAVGAVEMCAQMPGCQTTPANLERAARAMKRAKECTE